MIDLLVIATGDPRLGDGGFGSRAVAALAEEGDLPPGTRLIDGTGEAGSLVAEVEDARRLIVIDAIDLGAPPGEIRRYSARGIPETFARALSASAVALREVLARCRRRGTGPLEVSVWGVQVARLDPAAGLSPAVAAALPPVVAGVRAEIRRLADSDDDEREAAR